MTLLAGILDPELLIKSRARNGNAVVGSGKMQSISHASMLQEWHVATRAKTSGRVGGVMRVFPWCNAFAGMTACALTVIKSARQWFSKNITILLRMWIMTIHTSH